MPETPAKTCQNCPDCPSVAHHPATCFTSKTPVFSDNDPVSSTQNDHMNHNLTAINENPELSILNCEGTCHLPHKQAVAPATRLDIAPISQHAILTQKITGFCHENF